MNETIVKIFNDSIVRNNIPNYLYKKYNVKKGLRNEDGTGVLIALTKVADVVGYVKNSNNTKINIPGKLFYRGISIEELYSKISSEDEGSYEDVCFLLLFGYLANKEEITAFKNELKSHYILPEGYLATNILKSPSKNIMNMIQKALLLQYSEDELADDSSPFNTLKQGLAIIARLPAIIVYSYQAKAHFIDNKSLIIHPIKKELGLAESILYLLKGENNYTKTEVKLLDLMMIVHADHGSGNNSTFSNIVVSSTGTDIYSSFAASVGSLKGPKHGGANTICKQMMDAIINEIGIDADDEKILKIIKRILDKDFFDRKGLIYGMGHAVYTISDPRCLILKKQAVELANQCRKSAVLKFYNRFEEIAVKYLREIKNADICANVDFYSGFIYEMMGIPEDLYSPIFVASRAVGWLAHNLEDKLYSNKIIRPAGKYIGDENEDENDNLI